jgi:hypothetical protein
MARQKKSDNKDLEIIQPFRDKYDFNKIYKPGDDISDFEDDRIKVLIELNVVKVKANDQP